MAKKKREEEGDDPKRAKLPDFDEKVYLKKEMGEARMMLVVVAMAVMMGLLVGLMSDMGIDPRVAAVPGIFGVMLIKYFLDMLKFDTSKIEKMKWVGMGGTYLLTMLAVWVLLINPPFIDMVDPTIDDRTPERMEMGEDIWIRVLAEDNMDIGSVEIVVMPPPDWRSMPAEPMLDRGRNLYEYHIDAPMPGVYKYQIAAKDRTGHRSVLHGTFEIIEYKAPEISLYNAPSTIVPGDKMQVSIADLGGGEIKLAYYTFDPVTEDWYSRPDNKEQRLKFNEFGIGDIRTNDLTPGAHTLHVVAMDNVPHTRTEAVFEISVI